MQLRKAILPTCAGVLGLAALAAPARAADSYAEVVRSTSGMVGDANAQQLAQRHGLQVLDLTWEDTSRFKGSCVGDNISDMTIQVQEEVAKGSYRLTCMPVIRFPNFEDKSGDISPDRFLVPVGNERGRSLEPVTLREYLGNIRRYLTAPLSWKGEKTSLLCERDTRVLVSAQACFLPVPREGKAEFNPVLFNYQSSPGAPAVLAILVTREGTSATVIDNARDGFASHGQRLFFNQKGERALLSAERLSDWTDAQQAQQRKNGQPVTEPAADAGLDRVLLIQIPLKHAENRRFAAPCCAPAGLAMDAACCESKGRSSDVESAVIGHGKVEGPYTEIAGLAIERDERFPIRVTVQLYKATSNGVVSESDVDGIAKQIESVYASSENVGSLVTQGQTGRPTETVPALDVAWWTTYWSSPARTSGRADAIARLAKTFGADWRPASEEELRRALEVAGLSRAFIEGTPEVGEICGTARLRARRHPCGGVQIVAEPSPAERSEASTWSRERAGPGLYAALGVCFVALGLTRLRRAA